MNKSLAMAFVLCLGLLGLILSPTVSVRSYQATAIVTKPPPPSPATPRVTTTVTPPAPKPTPTPLPLGGGEWLDDFSNSANWSASQNVEASFGVLRLKLQEYLDWTQTYGEHFALGEFFQTEAISDSVRLARIAGTSEYYTTGIYTSTIFDASRSVDWIGADWVFSGSPYSLTVEYRTGDTLVPDGTWSDWLVPMRAFHIYCTYSFWFDRTVCASDLPGVESSRYLQYRVHFESGDLQRTIALEFIKLTYGIHPASGQVNSRLLTPGDMLAWQQTFYTASVPANTLLVVDVLSADGALLIPNAMNGTSLAGLDPMMHPSIKLRATLTTNDPSRSPEIDVWGVRWLVGWRAFFPVIGR